MTFRAKWASDFFADPSGTDWEPQESVPAGVLNPQARWLSRGPTLSWHAPLLCPRYPVDELSGVSERARIWGSAIGVGFLGPGSMLGIVEYR